MVKIYGAYPLLISEEHLIKRIDFYHKNNVLVSTGSTFDRICNKRKRI